MSLSVTLDDNYYWYATVPGHPDAEVFPIVTALVVARRDGGALTEDDEAAALDAANAHCAGLGLGATGPASNFADGTWAFSPCREA